jgi:type VI secretion system secreted protein Hcp
MASDLHMKVDGIEGDSRDSGHDKEIEVTSYSLGANMMLSSAGSAGSATTERASFQDFVVTKNLDKASAPLLLAVAKGTTFATVLLSVERPDGKGGKVKYMEYKLTDAVLSSYSTSHGGTGLPMESLSFGYGKIEWNYIPTDPATGDAQGNVSAGWDLGLNKPV